MKMTVTAQQLLDLIITGIKNKKYEETIELIQDTLKQMEIDAASVQKSNEEEID